MDEMWIQDRNILLYRDNFVALRQKHGERKPDIARSCNCDFHRDVLALFAGKIKGRLRVPQSETRKQIFDLRCKGRKPCDTLRASECEVNRVFYLVRVVVTVRYQYFLLVVYAILNLFFQMQHERILSETHRLQRKVC